MLGDITNIDKASNYSESTAGSGKSLSITYIPRIGTIQNPV